MILKKSIFSASIVPFSVSSPEVVFTANNLSSLPGDPKKIIDSLETKKVQESKLEQLEKEYEINAALV